MTAYLLLQFSQVNYAGLLTVIVLVLIVVGFVFVGWLRVRRASIQAPLPSRTVGGQEDRSVQLMVTKRQLVDIQERFQETHHRLIEAQKQVEEAQKGQKEAQERLAQVQEQLQKTYEQLRETQAQLRAAQNQQEEAYESELQEGSLPADALLHNSAWLKLTKECVTLFETLDRQSAGMQPLQQELTGYICSQFEEILERCGVTVISGDSVFDEHRHRPYPALRRVAAGTAIAETLSPGFVVGSRVLRLARVRLVGETD